MAKLEVFPAHHNAVNREMKIKSMTKKQIKSTIEAKPVQIFIMSHGQLTSLKKPKIPLAALVMVSPVVQDALLHSKSSMEDISKVILPFSETQPYTDILKWVYGMMKEGAITQFRQPNHSRLLYYDQIYAVAAKLGIDHLKASMAGRINDILRLPSTPTFTLEMSEVRFIFAWLRADHPFRVSVAQAPKEANLRHVLEPTFCKELTALVAGLPSLQSDLYGHTFFPYGIVPDWGWGVLLEEENGSANRVAV